jgi:hypothetical protein
VSDAGSRLESSAEHRSGNDDGGAVLTPAHLEK